MSEAAWHDLCYSFRTLRRDVGHTLAGIGLIALGVGPCAGVFCVVNAVILRPLPYRDSKRVRIIQKIGSARGENLGVSLPEFAHWEERPSGFEDLAAVTLTPGHLGGVDEVGPVVELNTSSGYFRLLGAQAQLGRTFAPGEDRTGSNRVAIISDGLWRRAFGGDRGVIGRSVQLDGISHSVIGVMPPRFHDPNYYQGADVWVPLAVDTPPALLEPRMKSVIVLGRVGRGLDAEQARTQLAVTARTWQAGNSRNATEFDLGLLGLWEVITANTSQVLLVFITTGCVLVIACTNLAVLLLVRANRRRREFAVRQALGAGQRRLVFQLLVESMFPAVGGGALATLLAKWLLPVLTAISPQFVPRIEEARFDAGAAVYVVVASVVMGLVAGLVATARLPRPGVPGSLATSLSQSTEEVSLVSKRDRAGRAQVVLQMALALLLAVDAGLVGRTFLAVRPVNIGFDPENKLVVRVRVPKTKYATPPEQIDLYGSLVDRLSVLPSVKSVVADVTPAMSGMTSIGHITRLGQSGQLAGGRNIVMRKVSDNYFQVMRVKLTEGRSLAKSDNASSPPVLVVNRTLAASLWPADDPIGQQVNIAELGPRELTVVGVADDERFNLGTTDRTAQAYVSYLQFPARYLTLVADTAIDPSRLTDAVRKQLASVDKDVDILPPQTMEQMLAASVELPKYLATLMTVLAMLAISVAAAGVYSVISYSAARCTREIGIRAALGAQPGDIVRMVLGEGLLLTTYGVGGGLVAALASGHFIASVLYGVKPNDAPTFIAVALILSGVALGASYLPARRAAAVDPAVAMRHE
jgi:predicted permease